MNTNKNISTDDPIVIFNPVKIIDLPDSKTFPLREENLKRLLGDSITIKLTESESFKLTIRDQFLFEVFLFGDNEELMSKKIKSQDSDLVFHLFNYPYNCESGYNDENNRGWIAHEFDDSMLEMLHRAGIDYIKEDFEKKVLEFNYDDYDEYFIWISLHDTSPEASNNN